METLESGESEIVLNESGDGTLWYEKEGGEIVVLDEAGQNEALRQQLDPRSEPEEGQPKFARRRRFRDVPTAASVTPEQDPAEQVRVELRGRLSSLNEARRKNRLNDAFAPALLHLPQRIAATSTLSDADAKIEFGKIQEALEMLESQVEPASDQPDAPPSSAGPRDILDDLNAPVPASERPSRSPEGLRTREEQREFEEALEIFINAYDDRTHESRLNSTPRAFRAAASRSIRAKHGRVVEALIRVISTNGENPPTVAVLRNLYSTIDAEINGQPREGRREKARARDEREPEEIKISVAEAKKRFEEAAPESEDAFQELYDEVKAHMLKPRFLEVRKWLPKQSGWLDPDIIKKVLEADEDFKKKTGEKPTKEKSPEEVEFEKKLKISLNKMFPGQD